MATARHIVTPEEAGSDAPLEAVVVRFAGDSGDGMQLTGGQFTLSTALAGNDLATFPDFPAEIRAPQGTTFGVSAFQINFGSAAIETAGDAPDVLIAMNPAALKTNVDDLKPGGLIIADEGEFGARNLAKAGYDGNPLDDDTLAKWQVIRLNISQLTLDAVKPFGLGNKEALRCKNMWTLGLALWMFDRDRAPDRRPGSRPSSPRRPQLAEANIAALNAGHAYGETAEMGGQVAQHHIAAAPAEPGLYRTITGAEAISLGLIAGCKLAGLPMFFGGYPITPGERDPPPSLAAQGIWRHHLPGRGRDRRHFRRDRGELRRLARRHLLVGPGHRAQDRGDGPRDHDRAAAGHHQLAARRPFDRPADQDRAIGPLPGGLRPQRRFADAGDRRPLARRRLRLRDRGLPDRGPVHDPGDPPDRRLYRQCRRALEGAGHGGISAVPGRVPRSAAGGRGGGQSLQARRQARPRLDQAGDAGADAPDRRHREECRHRPYRL